MSDTARDPNCTGPFSDAWECPVHRPTTGEREAAKFAQDVGGEIDALRAKVTALTLRAEQAERERDEARAFGVQAAKQYNELLVEHQNVTCAFCGEQYPRGTPRHGDGLLAEHIKTCRLHPMRESERALTALRERLETVENAANAFVARYNGPIWCVELGTLKNVLQAALTEEGRTETPPPATPGEET